MRLAVSQATTPAAARRGVFKGLARNCRCAARHGRDIAPRCPDGVARRPYLQASGCAKQIGNLRYSRLQVYATGRSKDHLPLERIRRWKRAFSLIELMITVAL